MINWILNSTFLIFYYLKKWFNGFPLFFPDRKLKITWDIVVAINFGYFFVMIPIDIAFKNGLLFEKYRLPTFCFTISLMANILIRLNTVVYKFGKAIAKREEIMSAYLSEGLVIDAVFCG